MFTERYGGSKKIRGIWYHGTSTKYLNDILTNGLIPNPKERSWNVDLDASAYTLDRSSYGGVYVTRNLMTATSSALRTASKTNGNKLVVILDLQPKSLIADEDDIASFFVNYHEQNAFYYYKLLKYGSEYSDYMRDLEIEKERFTKKVVKQISDSKDIKNEKIKDLLHKLISDKGFYATVTRIVAYSGSKPGSFSDMWTRCWDTRKIDIDQIPHLPTKEEGENVFRKFVNKLTILLKEIARSGGFLKTARSLEPIKFSGSNKIICVVEFVTYSKSPPKFKIHYGTLPQDFIDQYKQFHHDTDIQSMIIKENINEALSLSFEPTQTFTDEQKKQAKDALKQHFKSNYNFYREKFGELAISRYDFILTKIRDDWRDTTYSFKYIDKGGRDTDELAFPGTEFEKLKNLKRPYRKFRDVKDAVEEIPENPDSAYRGMSFEELVDAKKKGYFKSSGIMNIGSSQENYTFFGDSPKSAMHYVLGFQPPPSSATRNKPAVVIEVPKSVLRPAQLTIAKNTGKPVGNEHEFVTDQRINFSDVNNLWLFVPVKAGFGDFDIKYDKFYKKYSEGSRGPTSHRYKIIHKKGMI